MHKNFIIIIIIIINLPWVVYKHNAVLFFSAFVYSFITYIYKTEAGRSS
jgi:hypothetical protein